MHLKLVDETKAKFLIDQLTLERNEKDDHSNECALCLVVLLALRCGDLFEGPLQISCQRHGLLFKHAQADMFFGIQAQQHASHLQEIGCVYKQSKDTRRDALCLT